MMANANLSTCNLQGAKMDKAIGTNADLRGAKLSPVTISGAFHRRQTASLAESNFTQAKFQNADLEGVSFNRAILTLADFRAANLKGASFMDADLTNADFRGANMEGCDLRGAIGFKA